jgi:hypothetical protein
MEQQHQQPTEAVQTSRSYSSLNGKFEMISESEVRESAIQQLQQQMLKANVVAPFVSRQPGKKSRHVLKEGFKWQRQLLISRTKLNMNTAYDRLDNSEQIRFPSHLFLAISKLNLLISLIILN